MAHFAKLGANGKVVEDETVGQQWLETHNNWPAQMWIQTSYNTSANTHRLGGTPFRGNYAGIGFEWDEDNNIFWPKKPYASWVKNTTTAMWQSPIGDQPELTAEQISQNEAGTHSWSYAWNEEGQSWDLTDNNA